MKKLFLLLLLFILLAPAAKADEGMWLPSVISKERLKDMKKKGFKLKAEDIYSINKASLKDAVVLLRGCTGEIISNQGLVLTNHHCGLGQIQYHSSIEHDYITNGFSAMNQSEELASNDYWAAILVRMNDVTDEVTKGITSSMTDSERNAIIDKNKKEIIATATDGNGYNANIEALYYTNQYFIFVYERYNDVRLVCAPPAAIGNFGSDTDNWMWPRHTGDFCMFRIYANKDNKPATYSKDNIPYTPKRSFKISTKGVKENDFTFIYGFPGTTNEYLHSEAVRYIAEISNPNKIALRDLRLDVILEAMNADPATRIKYASKRASIANAWKKWQGEAGGIVKLDAIGKKQKLEADFEAWAAGKAEYEHIIPEFKELYAELEPYAFVMDYFNEAIMGIEACQATYNLPLDREAMTAKMELYYKNYDAEIDNKIAKALLNRYVKNISPEYVPNNFPTTEAEIDAMVDNFFATSLFTSAERFNKALELSHEELIENIKQDPFMRLRGAFLNIVRTNVSPKHAEINAKITQMYKGYMKGLMEMLPEKEFYPDANSTLRVAYGKICGFNPKDGVYYKPTTSLEGVIAKDNPDVYDYRVPAALHEVYKNKDFGRWEVNGSVPVCILGSNHTTGGNSGSPILNGKGELIGLNFDRCWESTMSDVIYDADMCRNIGVDIRYVLFLVEKICGAGYLLDEMDLK